MLWERFSLTFCTKVFPLFKIGQKNVQKRKPKILLGKKRCLSSLTENILTDILILIFLAFKKSNPQSCSKARTIKMGINSLFE